jgi:hypothetical protein
MKYMNKLLQPTLLLLLALASTGANAAQKDGTTLRQFREKYLNQRIIILKDTLGQFIDWEPLQKTRHGSFEHGKGAFLDMRYKDQTATIVAIEEYHSALDTQPKDQKNALGEVLSNDDKINPYVKIVAQFEDGQFATLNDYPSLLLHGMKRSLQGEEVFDDDNWESGLMLVSERDRHKEILSKLLPSAIGQKLYAVHDSMLFPLDFTSADLLDMSKRELKQLEFHDSALLLTPLTVTAATYNDRYDFIAWKLRSDDGRECMTVSRYRDGRNGSLLERTIASGTPRFMSNALFLRIPSGLTPREIDAISHRKIFRGMSHQAVIYSWGKGKENDYGRGGKQLVYDDGHQLVYLDSEGKVTDWQDLH